MRWTPLLVLLVCWSIPAEPEAAPVSQAGLEAEALGYAELVSRTGPTLRLPTIQAAIDLAADGDTILLSPGSFRGVGNRDLLVTGKNVVIAGKEGPAKTIIDCGYQGRAITFEGPEVTRTSSLTGVTIANGDAAKSNLGFGLGGGILAWKQAGPSIEQCTIRYCRGSFGGGVALVGSPGAAHPPLLTGCRVLYNEATSTAGGGVYGSDAIIERCLVVGNRALSGQGGGVYCGTSGGFAAVRSSLILDNSAQFGGGLLLGGELEMTGCTVVANHSTAGSGSGVALASDPAVTVSSTIIWGNRDPAGSSIFQVHQAIGTGILRATFRYCTIEGGSNAVSGTLLTKPLLFAIGQEYPDFIAPDEGDYRLEAHSPCIDAGDPEYHSAETEADIEGQVRCNGRLDIGADEHWDGLVLARVQPGRSGVWNSIHLSGARPHAPLLLFGTVPRNAPLLSGLCTASALEGVQLLAILTSNGHGAAVHAQLVPLALEGSTLVFGALEWNGEGGPCRSSNAVFCAFL